MAKLTGWKIEIKGVEVKKEVGGKKDKEKKKTDGADKKAETKKKSAENKDMKSDQPESELEKAEKEVVSDDPAKAGKLKGKIGTISNKEDE